MPKNERSLKRYKCSSMPRNETRRVVRNRATRRSRSPICEGTRRFDRRSHDSLHRGSVTVLLRLRIQFHRHSIGIDVIKKDLEHGIGIAHSDVRRLQGRIAELTNASPVPPARQQAQPPLSLDSRHAGENAAAAGR